MKTIIDNVKFIQLILKEYLNENSIAVDMTCGNGFDSLFLASHCRKVYCFDIQKQAIENSMQLLKNNNVLDKCELFQVSHQFVDKYVLEKVDVIIYNLGFLPHGDVSTTTNYHSTIESLEKGLKLLNINGIVCLSLYWGHEEGKIEREKVKEFVSKLDRKYHVAYYQKLNQNYAPEIIFIEKVKE